MPRFDEVDDPRRRLVLLALSAGILAPPAIMAAPMLGNVPRQLAPGRSIYRLEGQVSVNGRPVTLESEIRPGNIIETGSNGLIIFVVEKDAYILRANSKLVLVPPSRQSTIARSLTLLSGALLSVFGGNEHRIQTPLVTVGIRGTGVYLESDPEQTYFCTCYGLVDMVARQDATSRETIESQHHDKPVYILAKGDKGRLIRPAPMKNHSDVELALVEELVGRTPPFVFPQDDYKAPRREY